MLTIVIEPVELFNQITSTFTKTKRYELVLEHSLVSISKWESKWKKPFISVAPKTVEESVDYIRCMTITQNVPDEAYEYLSQSVVDQVTAYIDDPMTATTIHNPNKSGRNEIVTSELIYYWLITLNIPVEFQRWHLNRLLTLISVCNLKSEKPKKMSRSQAAAQQRSINAARRAKYGSSG